MSDEPTTIKVPAGWGKAIGGIIAILAAGGGSSVLVNNALNDRVVTLEAQVKMIQELIGSNRGWLFGVSERVTELEKRP